MKYGLISTRLGDNLGDDIQTLAVMKQLPRVDSVIYRERISQARVSPGMRVIIAGWFMHNTRFWPPNKHITPLFLSFHARPARSIRPLEWLCDNILGMGSSQACADAAYQSHYNQWGPVGCRDRATERALNAINVPAFFSGCLTLTLKPKNLPRSDEVVFVDPFGAFPHNVFNPALWLSLPKGLRSHARCLSHLNLSLNLDRRLQKAQECLAIYEQAGLVVTSRLHVALPCLALGTPVIFLSNNHRSYRLEGYERFIQPVAVKDFIKTAQHGDIRELACKVDREQLSLIQVGLENRCRTFLHG